MVSTAPHEAGPEPRPTKIAPQALFALEDALALIYWYKPDLERFVRQTVDAPEILARVSLPAPSGIRPANSSGR